jgi:RNA polymerase-binding transcription factor DksA
MKPHDPDSPNGLLANVSHLQQALEAKRDELIRNHVFLQEVAVGQMAASTKWDLAVERIERNAFLLHLVLDALDRIAQGLYGKCLNCGAPVCAKGLTALPWVALCQRCQEATDSRSAIKRSTIFHAA